VKKFWDVRIWRLWFLVWGILAIFVPREETSDTELWVEFLSYIFATLLLSSVSTVVSVGILFVVGIRLPDRRRKKKACKVFISYRRDDTQGMVERLYTELEESFADVFKDIGSLQAAANLSEEIPKKIANCDVFLLVMGPEWLGSTGQGDLRIHQKTDWVRSEVKMALERNKPLIPIFTNGLDRMWDVDELPDDIKPIVDFVALPLRHDPDFDQDVLKIQASVERICST